MRYVLPLLFLVLASACSTVRQLPSTDSTKVEVRTKTVFQKDTVFVELPLVVERVTVLDTVSVLENQLRCRDPNCRDPNCTNPEHMGN